MTEAAASPADARSSATPNPNIIVVVPAIAGITVSLMQTLVIPLDPDLPRPLDPTPANTAWIVTATLLAASVATPAASDTRAWPYTPLGASHRTPSCPEGLLSHAPPTPTKSHAHRFWPSRPLPDRPLPL